MSNPTTTNQTATAPQAVPTITTTSEPGVVPQFMPQGLYSLGPQGEGWEQAYEALQELHLGQYGY